MGLNWTRRQSTAVPTAAEGTAARFPTRLRRLVPGNRLPRRHPVPGNRGPGETGTGNHGNRGTAARYPGTAPRFPEGTDGNHRHAVPTGTGEPGTTAEGTDRAARAAHIAEIMTVPRRLIRFFYACVLTIALVGQAQAAAGWLHWVLAAAAAAVLALEVGGVTIFAYADARRQLKERAVTSRLLSAGIAGFAVFVNWQGHLNHGHATIKAGFFAGFSLLGYVVFVLDSEARRRDRMRIDGDMVAPPPSYELALWVSHPVQTRHARTLAKADPTLGAIGSYQLAGQQIDRAKRNAAIAAALAKVQAANVDPTMAEVAQLTADLDRIADGLCASFDYDGYTAHLAGQLTVDKLTNPTGKGKPKPTTAPPAAQPAPQPTADALEEPTVQVKPVPTRVRARATVTPQPADDPEPVSSPPSVGGMTIEEARLKYAGQIQAVKDAFIDWQVRTDVITVQDVVALKIPGAVKKVLASIVRDLVEMEATRQPFEAEHRLANRNIMYASVSA